MFSMISGAIHNSINKIELDRFMGQFWNKYDLMN